jgi:hypothetical protein
MPLLLHITVWLFVPQVEWTHSATPCPCGVLSAKYYVHAAASSYHRVAVCPSGGVDKGLCPSISSLRPGSVAQRCDALCAGDRVTAVNGISTSRLKHDEIVSLLRGVEDRAVLDLEYPLPSFRKSHGEAS